MSTIGGDILSDHLTQNQPVNSNLASVTINVEVLLEEKDKFAERIDLSISKNQVNFSQESLFKEINKLNYKLKQKLRLSTIHFLYKGIIELETLGTGGFGSVLKAYDPDSQVFFAKKVVNNKKAQEFLSNAIAEILAVYNLSEINDFSLLSIYRISFTPNMRIEIYMEYGIGTLHDLLTYMEQTGCIFETFLSDLNIELSKQLEILHKNGICHRDIKPENVIISRDFKFKFSDFGCSTKFRMRGKRSLTVAGTYKYMSDSMKQAMNSGGYAYTCPFEEDEHLIRETFKEATERSKNCKKIESKVALLNKFDAYMNHNTFSKLGEDFKTKELIVRSLEKIYWDPSSNVKLTPENIDIIYNILVFEKQGEFAYGQNIYVALDAYLEIADLLVKSNLQEYRGVGLIRAAEITKKIGRWDTCKQLCQLQKKYYKVNAKEPDMYKKMNYMLKMDRFYTSGFDEFMKELIKIEDISSVPSVIEQKIKDRVKIEAVEQSLLNYDVNYITYYFCSIFQDLFKAEYEREVSALIIYIINYYEQYLFHVKNLKKDAETAKSVFSIIQLIRKIDKSYQNISPYAQIEMFEQAKALLSPHNNILKADLMECELEIAYIMSDISSDADLNRKSQVIFNDALKMLDENETDPKKHSHSEHVRIMYSLVHTTKIEERYEAYKRLLNYAIDKNISSNKFFFNICLEIIHYCKFHERTEHFNFKKRLEQINKKKWEEAWHHQIALEYGLVYSSKDEFEALMEFEGHYDPFPITSVNDILKIWDTLHEWYDEKDLEDFVARQVEKYSNESGNYELKGNFFIATCIIALYYLEKSDEQELFKNLINFIQRGSQENLESITMKNKALLVFKEKNNLFQRVFEYICKSFDHKALDFKELYQGIFYFENQNYLLSLKYLCSFYENQGKNLFEEEIITFVEYLGWALINMYDSEQQDHPYTIKGNNILKELLKFKFNSEKVKTKAYLESTIEFFLLNFSRAKSILDGAFGHVDKNVNEAIDAMLMYRYSCIMMVENEKKDAQNFYEQFLRIKFVLQNDPSKFEFYFLNSNKFAIKEVSKDYQPSLTKKYRGKKKFDSLFSGEFVYDLQSELVLQNLRIEFKEIISKISDTRQAGAFILSGIEGERLESMSKFSEIAIKLLQKSLPDYKILELYYINAFSKLNIFNRNNFDSHTEMITEFKNSFDNAIEIHKKYSDEIYRKALDDFRTWVYLMIELKKIENIKDLVYNFMTSVNSWDNCPLVIVPLLSGRWLNVKNISKIKKISSSVHDKLILNIAPDSLIQAAQYRDYFINYNKEAKEEKVLTKIDKIRKKISELVREHDDFDEVVLNQYRILYLYERENNDVHEKEAQILRILETNNKNDSKNFGTLMPLLCFYTVYLDHSLNQENILKTIEHFKQRLNTSDEFFTKLFEESVIKLETPLIKNNKVSLTVKMKFTEEIFAFLENDRIFEQIVNSDEDYFTEDKSLDILLNKQIAPSQRIIPEIQADLSITKKVEKHKDFFCSSFNPVEIAKLISLFSTDFAEPELFLAIIFSSAKNVSQAILQYIAYLKKLKQNSAYDRNISASIYLHIAYLCMKIEAIELAISSLESCINEIEAFDFADSSISIMGALSPYADKFMVPIIKMRKAFLYSRLGRREKCFEVLNSMDFEILKGHRAGLILKKIYLELGFYYFTQDGSLNKEKMKSYFTKAEKLSDESMDEQVRKSYKTQVMISKAMNGKYKEAVALISEQTSDPLSQILGFCLFYDKKEKSLCIEAIQNLEEILTKPIDLQISLLIHLFLLKYFDTERNNSKTKEYSEKFLETLEILFKTKPTPKVCKRSYPDSFLPALKQYRLFEITLSLEQKKLTLNDFLTCFFFLNKEWQSWNSQIFQHQHGYISSFFHKPLNPDHEGFMIVDDLSNLNDVTEYEKTIMKSKFVNSVCVEDYLKEYVSNVMYRDCKYNFYVSTFDTSNLNHNFPGVEEKDGEETLIYLQNFNFPPNMTIKEVKAFCTFLTKLQSPYLMRPRNFYIDKDHRKLFYERVDNDLETIICQRRRYIGYVAMPEESVMTMFKQILVAVLKLSFEFPHGKLELRHVGLNKVGEVKLDMLAVWRDKPIYSPKKSLVENLSLDNQKDATGVLGMGLALLEMMTGDHMGEENISKETKDLIYLMMDPGKYGLTWEKIYQHPAIEKINLERGDLTRSQSRGILRRNTKKKSCFWCF